MKQLSIGALARQTGLAVSAIRYYEECGLLPPVARKANNRRSYDDLAVVALTFISACRSNGMSLKSIAQLQRKLSEVDKPCVEAVQIINRTIREITGQIASLQAARLHLSKVATACSPASCDHVPGACNISQNMGSPSNAV